jgi:uncharacterized protein (DUF2237 family)
MATDNPPSLPLKGHQLVRYSKQLSHGFFQTNFKCSCGNADFGWHSESTRLDFVAHCLAVLGADDLRWL